MMESPFNRKHCEFVRYQTMEKFDRVRSTWIDLGRWTLPHRTRWLLAQTEGERNNHHITDVTHLLALRSFVAGFLEGNTSATRPWYRHRTGDEDLNRDPENHEYLDALTAQTFQLLATSNFYNAAGEFYYDFGTFNTGCIMIEEKRNGRLHFHLLMPGSYRLLNDALGEANMLVREFCLNVKALVERYGQKVDGDWDWSNFSDGVKNAYTAGNYSQYVDVVQIVQENPEYDVSRPQSGANRRWVTVTYEVGSTGASQFAASPSRGYQPIAETSRDEERYLEVAYSRRKPFIAGRSHTGSLFEYGEKGPTLDGIGLIKSLCKKALSKDQAIELMLQPGLQGPANLRRSYLTAQSRAYIPLDPHAMGNGGIRSIYEVNPAIGALTGDVMDIRAQVDRLYYSDFLLYLSRNPKTRTATEAQAVVQEQQMVIGPNLQSLNWTFNVPIFDFVTDYVIENSPYLPPTPETLQGQFVRPEFISIFAQSQRAADLPSIREYVGEMMNISQLNPDAAHKVNLDRYADLLEDRLYLPAGLNRPQAVADAMREQAQAMQARRQQMEQMAVAAKAGKDLGMQINPQEGQS